jgi:L-iditol 2-dehydrogenase
MKVASYYGKNDIRIEEKPEPEIGENEALVEMKACGVCGSDLMDWYLASRAPVVLGHEPAGIIAKKGREVEDFNVGDRVFVHHHVACLTCHYCLRGDYTLCEEFHRTNIHPGGFAEYFRVPAENLRIDTLKIPDTLSFEEATLIEPTGCCLRGLKKCNVQAGDSLAVIGVGAIGIIHVALSKILGVAGVFVSDVVDYRLSAAERFGADLAVNPEKEDFVTAVRSETDGLGADVVVVTAPSLEAYETGLKACRKGGRLCVFAPLEPKQRLQLSVKEMFFSEVQIVPSYSTSHMETRTALELIRSGALRVKDLITHKIRLSEAAKAFETARENKNSLKVVVLNE